jgi:ribonuclease D
MPPPLTDVAELGLLVKSLSGSEAVGIDTEFMRERTYYAQLCLLQLSDTEHSGCVDTLALEDLTPLRALLADPKVCKILHAARQDLEVLWPAAGAVRNVFDTQVAAGLIGLPAQIGYGDLVSRLLDIQLHKGQTRTDWSRRPLSPEQLQYAIEDVLHLPPLRLRLLDELAQRGRLAWFKEDSAALDAASASFEVNPEEAWLRLKGFSELDEGRIRVARLLAGWRERRAMAANRPRGWILPDPALREIVQRVPRSSADLERIQDLPEGIRDRSGEQILALVSEAGVPNPAPALPQRRRPDAEQLARIDRLAQVAREVAGQLQIAPELLVTRKQLERLADGDRAASALNGWRREIIGEPLLAAL